MASWLNRLWSGLDFYDEEENQKQRQQFAAQTRARQQAPRPVAQTRSAGQSMEWKIQNAKYGVLANNPQRQTDFLNSIKPENKLMSTGKAIVQSALESPVKVGKSLTKPFWETADAAKQLPGALTGRNNGLKESLDQSIIGGVGRFGQSVASTALTPVSNRLADQERKRAEQLLTPAYEKMYAAYGHDPRLGKNQAQIEAGQADYNIRTDPLSRSNIGVNDSLGTTTRKVGAQGAEAALDLMTAPYMALATKSAAAGGKSFVKDTAKALATKSAAAGGKSFVKDTAKSALLSGTGNVAYAAQQDAVKPLDVAGQFAVGAAVGAALPVTTRLVAPVAKKAGGALLDAVAPVQTTTRLVKRTNRLNLDTTDALKAYSDMLVDADPYIQGKVRSDLISRVRQIGDELGVDLTNGSVADKMDRIEAILNGYLPMTETRRQLAIPEVSADYDPKYSGALDSLKQEARKYKSAEEFVRAQGDKYNPNHEVGDIVDGRKFTQEDYDLYDSKLRYLDPDQNFLLPGEKKDVGVIVKEFTDIYNQALKESQPKATSRPAQSPQPTKQPQGQLSGSTSPYQNPSLPDTPAKPNTQTLVQTPEVKSKQVSGQPSDTGIAPSKVKDKQLRDLQTVRKQLIDAETDAILESGRPQRNLIKEVLDAGGISSSAYETLPKGVRRKSGMSADRVAQELGFDSEDSLVQALNDYADNPNRKMTRTQAREQAIELLGSGKSQYDEDWKLLQQMTGERQLELERLNASKITESKPQKQAFPSYEEFESLTKSAEAQNPANKTRRSVAAASSELKTSQKQAVLEGDIKKANAIREKVGEIEKGLKRTPPDLSKSAEELIHDIPEIKDIKGKTNKAVKERFMAKANSYLGERRAATYSAVDKARTFNSEFPDLTDAQRLEIIHAADQASYKSKDPVVNKAVKRLHEQYDQAYRYFTKERGINMGYQHSYYPRIYKHPKTGELINSAEFDLLQRASSRQKGRTSDIIASDFLVTKDPAEALTMYHRSLENAAAGKKFMNELEQDGLVVYSTEPVRGMRPVVAEGMQDAGGVYYARPEVAKSLDRMFGTQEASGAFEKIVENGQGLNSFVQSLVLSGGIPNTPVNAFGFMQVMKSSMAGHPIQAGKAFLKSLGRKQSDNFFKANSDVLQEMARNGLDVRVNYQAKYRNMFGRIKDSAQGGRRKMVAEAWDQFTNDATFQRFMPMLETMHYKQIRDGLIKRGAKPEVAAKRAADATSNFFGKTKLATQATRSKVGQDALGAVAFAPRFRESMVNFWGKNLQSVKPANWGKAEWRANQAFIMAAAATWAGMEGANMALNGNWMHDNPDGKKDKLLIPGLTSDGKDVGIPFLPSIATVPRNAAMGLFNAATGKFEEAGKNLQSFASMPLKTGIETFTNENYFGQRIVDEDASALEKLGQMGSHIAKSNMQPWVREGLNVAGQNLPDGVKKTLGIKEKSGFETASNALEAPLRFYDPKYYKGGQGKLVANSVFSNNKSKKIGVTTEKNKYGGTTSRDKYDAIIDAYYKNKDGSIKVNDYGTDQLRNTIKEVKSDLSKELKQAGLRDLAKTDSRHAVEYAKYRKSLEGKDELEVQKLSKNFYRKSYLGEMDKRTQAFYKLSDDAMRTAIQGGKINKAQLRKAVEIDNYLTETGLQRYYQIGKKLRAELGIAGGSTGRSGGRRSGGKRGGSGGRKSRLSFEPFKFAKKSSHLNKELRALIESAGAPSKAFPKAKKTPNYS